MLPMSLKPIEDRIRALVARTHNLTKEMREAALKEEIEKGWRDSMGKAERYVRGVYILERGGHFNTLSLGNWVTVAEAAGIETIPTRLACVVDPVMLMQVAMHGVSDTSLDGMSKFIGSLQSMREDEILRFDPCAAGEFKQIFAFGRADNGLPPFTGIARTEHGIFPVLEDQRLLDQFIGNPENEMPVWLRRWVAPVMMEGDARVGHMVANLPEHRPGPDDEMPRGTGNLYPCEWRVFVLHGEIAAIGNYYPQISRGHTEEDLAVALRMAAEARAATSRIISLIRDCGAIPHHPRYEMREGFDPDAIHFSIDFIEAEDADAPDGRRLVLLEGGPAHLRHPHWGANPVSFGTEAAPAGLALGPGNIRPLESLPPTA